MIEAPATDRREMILSHMPLARRLARRYASPPHAADDLVQVAYLGLVKAVDRYDPERGGSLATFAVPTILGELKRHFRQTRWPVHLPRELQERALRIEREVEALTSELGRTPTAAEVASRVSVSAEDVIEARAVTQNADALSLDAELTRTEEGDSTLLDTLGDPDPGFEGVDDVATLGPAFGLLDARSQTVLRMSFVDELSQREIGRRIGVSQMHVSRLLARARARLREAVEEPAPL